MKSQPKHLIVIASLCLMPTLSAAQSKPEQQNQGATDMQHMNMDGMMMGSMMSKDGMMNCPMARGMGYMMPQLPPGNDKLQLQMQAEILQQVSQITAKYADKIKPTQ